jgi:hypothetical protein
VSGQVDGNWRVDIYRAALDPSGCGEGDVCVGSAWPDATGSWTTIVTGLFPFGFVTAVSMDWSAGSFSNTSEFSPSLQVKQTTAVPPGTGGSGFALELSGANPFHSATGFRLTLSSPGAATLRILDPTGRAIRTLVSATLPAGRSDVRWDGLDDRGQRVPAGVYLAEFRADGRRASRAVVRME